MSSPPREARYRLIRQLARGGMGEIWLGSLRGAAGFEKAVVIKRVLSHLEDDPEFLARFIDEARIAASLSHGCIVPVFDLGEDEDGTFFLAMEWVDGWDLRKVLRTLRASEEAMPPDIAAFVAAQLCAGLSYAHTRTDEDGAPLHIVHRDVSPSNVLLSRAGEVKLTDFGIASARERLGKTATGQLRGKFSYMSPEQATGAPVDARSDVFSVGALLYEMLSGRKAFDGSTDLETLEMVRTGTREPLASMRDDLPEGLVALTERALSMSASDRFPAAAIMEEALREVIAEHWPTAGAARLRRWARERLAADPVLKAQGRPGGANLDDVLNAQLDAGPDDSTPSHTDSRSLPSSFSNTVDSRGASGLPARRSGPVPARSAGSHTVTHAVPSTRRRSRGPAVVVVALLAAGALVAAFSLANPAAPKLVVESEPPGAQVYVDGVPAGVSTLRLSPRPGPHEIQVRMPGYATAVETLTVGRGDSRTVRFDLRASDRAIAFHSVPPGALVSVGDTQVPAGNSVHVPVGRPVRVHMELEGHETFEQTVTFSASDTVFTRRLTPLPSALGSADSGGAGDDDRAGTNGAGTNSAGATRDARPQTDERRTERDVDRAPRDAGAGVAMGAENDGGADVAPALPPGRLVVRFVEPPMVGVISIDGVARGQNEDLQAVFELPPGEHAIVVENAALGVRYATAVDIQSDEDHAIAVDWR